VPKTRLKQLLAEEKYIYPNAKIVKSLQNFTCTWPEHSTIVSSWMLKCNASAVVVAVAEKM